MIPDSFNKGDRIIHPEKLIRGTVLEVDDGIAYLEMDNGVEMDFPEGVIVREEYYKSPEEKRQEEMALADSVTLAVAELILPEVRNLLVGLAKMRAEKAGEAVRALGGTAAPWRK